MMRVAASLFSSATTTRLRASANGTDVASRGVVEVDRDEVGIETARCVRSVSSCLVLVMYLSMKP